MKAENTKWQPKGQRRGRMASKSALAIRALLIGDVKRIIHDDVMCKHSACSLPQEIRRLRKQGWNLEYYHEKVGVLVIRRLPNENES